MTGRRALATVAVVALLAGTGCFPGDQSDRGHASAGGSVTVALGVHPGTHDPALASSPEALQALWLVHTPLLTYARVEGAAGTRLAPGLAAEMPELSEDGRTLTLTLREGLRYSDGQPVLAGDFERAVKRALRLHPRGVELFGNVRGARRAARSLPADTDISGIAADGRTGEVRIDLIAPDPSFPWSLAAPMAAPVPAGTPVRELSDSPPPGVGPYRLGAPREGDEFVLARRQGFGLPGVPAGNVDEVAGRVVEDPAAQARAGIDSQVDVAQGRPPVDLLPRIRSEYKNRYSEHATPALDYLAMDVSRRPFSDVEMRRAVSFAIDEAALKRLSDGFLEPTCNAIPPQVAGYRGLDPCPYGDREGDSDLVRARALVETSRAVQPPVLVTGGGLGGHAAERYLADTLDKIGLEARRARTPRERAQAQIAFARRLPALPLPAGYLQIVDDGVLDRRIELMEREADAVEDGEQWAALDREIVESAEVAPYGVETTGVLMSERMDAENCRRFHPVFGLDWSSLCLR